MPYSQSFDAPTASSSSNANTNPSNSYFTYPVKYAVASAFRRLPSNFRTSSSRSSSMSRDPSRTRSTQPTNHDRMPNEGYQSSQPQTRQTPNLIDLQDDDDFGDYADGSEVNSTTLPPPPRFAASSRNNSYSPSPRATPPPPFQPPPLTPLSLNGLPRTSDHQILSKLIAEEIRLLLPPRLQLMDTWRILFSLERDGASLKTLYEICEEQRGTRAGFVIVIRDSGGLVSCADSPTDHKRHGCRRSIILGRLILDDRFHGRKSVQANEMATPDLRRLPHRPALPEQRPLLRHRRVFPLEIRRPLFRL